MKKPSKKQIRKCVREILQHISRNEYECHCEIKCDKNDGLFTVLVLDTGRLTRPFCWNFPNYFLNKFGYKFDLPLISIYPIEDIAKSIEVIVCHGS